MIKIFHIADLHLGLSFRNLPEARATLFKARYETLQKTVNQANELDADLFVIAGDLFEKISLNVGDIQKAVKSINSFLGERALVLPGNHDYITPDSRLWDRFKKEAEEHVQVLDTKEPLPLEIDDREIIVYPAPCHARHSDENAIGWVEELAKDEEAIQIGIAHGSIEGVSPDFDGRYYPMSIHELEQAGVDLWLMGHTHITWPEKPGKRDIIFNPGTPEPDGFSCTHDGHAFLHTIDEQKHIETEIIHTGQYRFLKATEEIANLREVEKLISTYTDDHWQQKVLGLKVRGKVEQDVIDAWHEGRSKIRDSVLELRLDDSDVRLKVSKEQIHQEFSDGSFPEQLLSSFSDENEEEELQVAYELIKEVQQ